MERKHGHEGTGIVHAINIALLALVMAFAVAIPLIPASRAATTFDVSIVNFAFQPSDLTILPGDSVRWTNSVSTTHSVRSDTGSAETFNSPDLGLSGVFTYTFNNEGDFSYHCGQHPSMHGTVHVTSLIPEFSSIPIILVGLLVVMLGLTRVFRKG